MPLIERYLFRQLTIPTLWAMAALGALGLLSQSLSGLDIIVDSRQTIWVFVRLTLLAMPLLISILAPVAVFTATLITLNRLQTEREITVCFAGGMSRWELIAPAMRLAVLAAIACLFINLWIQPLCQRALRDETNAVRGDLASTMVREGDFAYPAPGVTVYAQEVGRRGQIKNLFVNQKRKDGSEATFTARQARVIKRDGGPTLLMLDGSVQTMQDGRLGYGTFREYGYDLSDVNLQGPLKRYKASDRFLHELFSPDLTQDWEKHNRKKLIAEGHSRLASPLYNIAVMALALAAVLGGGFSRLGYGSRIAAYSAGAAILRILGFGVQALCEKNVGLNFLQYAVPLGATAWALYVLFKRVRAPEAPQSPAIDIGPRAEAGLMRFRLNALENYVLRQTLINVAAAGALITAVILMIQFVDLSRQVSARYDVSFVRVAELTLLRAPSVLIILMPFMFLFGALSAFVGLNRRSELVAMRAAGVSAWRFIMPAAVAAFVVGLITVGGLSPISADLLTRFDRARAAIEDPTAQNQPKDVWLRDSDGRNQVVIKAASAGREGGQLMLKNATFYIYAITREGGAEFVRRLDASTAVLKPNEWRMTGVRESTPDSGAITSETLALPSSTNPGREIEHFASPDAISFWDLGQAIKTTEEAGYTAAGYRLRQQQLLATPILFAAMSILGAAFSLRLMRLGGLAVLATSGVALGFIFFFLNELSGAVGKADLAPLFIAAWAPPVLALLCGLTLLIYTEDG